MTAPLLFVAVHYRSPEAARGLLAALARQTDPALLEVVLVDNSGDFAPGTAPLPFPLHVLRPGTNTGYFGGAEHALRRFAPAGRAAVVVANVDVTPAPDFAARLVAGRYAPDVLVVAPDLRDRRGRPLNPFLRTRPGAAAMRARRRLVFSTPFTFVAYTLVAAAWRALRRPAPPAAAGASCYAAHGACLVFRPAYFARGGHVRHFAFLYLEEVFVAEAVRALSGRIEADPALRVAHAGHVSTGRIRLGSTGRAHRRAFAEAVRRYF